MNCRRGRHVPVYELARFVVPEHDACGGLELAPGELAGIHVQFFEVRLTVVSSVKPCNHLEPPKFVC